jgi:DNA-binding response OmpR family regulator
MRILLTGHDARLLISLQYLIRDQEFPTEIAAVLDIVEALDYQSRDTFDLVMITAGKQSGFFMKSTVSHLRQHGSRSYVLVIADESSPTERAAILDAGADYVFSIPAHLDVISAYVRAIHRKIAGITATEYRWKDLRVDTRSKSVWAGHKRIHCSPNEYKILELLCSRGHSLLQRCVVYQELFDEQSETDREHVTNVHIARVRNKLRPFIGDRAIETVRGLGWRLST